LIAVFLQGSADPDHTLVEAQIVGNGEDDSSQSEYEILFNSIAPKKGQRQQKNTRHDRNGSVKYDFP
jgi:hypothetical protein